MPLKGAKSCMQGYSTLTSILKEPFFGLKWPFFTLDLFLLECSGPLSYSLLYLNLYHLPGCLIFSNVRYLCFSTFVAVPFLYNFRTILHVLCIKGRRIRDLSSGSD